MEAASALAELVWLVLQALVGVIWMCFDKRGLAVVVAAALWLWLVDSSSTSWIVVPGVVLVAGLCIKVRRERRKKAAAPVEVPVPEREPQGCANIPGADPSSGGPA